MTESKPSLVHVARSDPLGAGVIVCAVLVTVLSASALLPPVQIESLWERSPPTLSDPPRFIRRPLERPPEAWRQSASPLDVLTVAGRTVQYWGRPDAPYAGITSEPFRAVIVHFTDETPILRLVKYGHTTDIRRGGSFGYHVYIDRAGRILQGAPLGRRTNHIKPPEADERTGTRPDLHNGNVVGVSLVGACASSPAAILTYRCSEETITADQMAAASAVVNELRARFRLPCGAIVGHGELQTDRLPFEGRTLARQAREECSAVAGRTRPQKMGLTR